MCYFPWGTVSPKGNGPRQVPLFMALQIRYPLEWGGHVRLPRSLAVWMGRLWSAECFKTVQEIHSGWWFGT